MNSLRDILYFMSTCVNFVNSYFRVFNQKEYRVLKSSWDQLQEYAIKNGNFYLKNSKYLDLGDAQDQIDKK